MLKHLEHGGDIHKTVKAQSMKIHTPREGRKDGGKAMSSEKEGGSADYGRGMELDKEPEDDVKNSYTMPGDVKVRDAAHGIEPKKRGGKANYKAKGGKAEPKKHVELEGADKKHRMDRPARKRGGGVGADMTPLSTANKTDDRRGPSKADDDRGITGEH